jgi:hypothetical protein
MAAAEDGLGDELATCESEDVAMSRVAARHPETGATGNRADERQTVGGRA